jgi:hypothetical protein
MAPGRSRRRTPDGGETRKQLEQERKKLTSLVAAIEGGSEAPGALLKAIAEREATIGRLEKELAGKQGKREIPADIRPWVEAQLRDLTGLLHDNVPRTKTEFRRLHLQLAFSPVEAKPRAYFTVKGQCDLTALAFSLVRTYLRERQEVRRIVADALKSADVDRLLEDQRLVTGSTCGFPHS